MPGHGTREPLFAAEPSATFSFLYMYVRHVCLACTGRRWRISSPKSPKSPKNPRAHGGSTARFGCGRARRTLPGPGALRCCALLCPPSSTPCHLLWRGIDRPKSIRLRPLLSSAGGGPGRRRRAAGHRRQATGDRPQATGHRPQATGHRRPRSGPRGYSPLPIMSNKETSPEKPARVQKSNKASTYMYTTPAASREQELLEDGRSRKLGVEQDAAKNNTRSAACMAQAESKPFSRPPT